MKGTQKLLQSIIRQYSLPPLLSLRSKCGLWNTIGHLRIRVIGQPTVVKDIRAKIALNAMPKASYYAVHTGHKPGIYLTWAEAEAQVKGYPAAKFKKFPSQAAAQEFMEGSVGPYAPPNHAQTPSARTSQPDDPFRASSPPTAIDPSLLPSDLQELSRKGYTFSKDQRLVVYTDGSGLGNGQVGAKAGLGVFWGRDGEAGARNLSERVPGKLQTNNRGELLSVIRAVELCPYPSIPLEIRTDSQYTISSMTTYLPKWMRNNFRLSAKTRAGGDEGKGIKNVDLIKHLLVLLRRRQPKAGVRFKYVAAHVGWEGNEAADKLAKRGAMMPSLPERTDWLDPEDDDESPAQIDPERQRDVDVELDASWLLTADEMMELEREFKTVQ